MLQQVGEVAWLFFKLGALSFGGPAAYIALMEEEAVVRRQWMTHERFLDLLGMSNLIPGPSAVELACQIGYDRAGRLGLIAAGIAFCLPGALITTALAWVYIRFQSLPALQPILAGIKPVVVAIVVAAIGRLGRRSLRTIPLLIIGGAVCVAALIWQRHQIEALLIGGVLGAFLLQIFPAKKGPPQNEKMPGKKTVTGALAALFWASVHQIAYAGEAVAATAVALTQPATVEAVATFSLGRLAWFCLKVGALLYGSGYVLIAYLQEGFVGSGWITKQQLIDAIAAGQITPGPLLSTVTFLGYVMGGLPGAAVATIAIITPSFVLVAITYPLIARLRRWRFASLFLDAIAAASIGIMVAVTVFLAKGSLIQGSFVDWRGCLLMMAALILTLRWRAPSALLVLGGAAAGWLLFS